MRIYLHPVVSPETAAWLAAQAQARDLPVGRILDELVRNEQQRTTPKPVTVGELLGPPPGQPGSRFG